MTIIQTPTPNLQQSLGFYQQLNFQQVSENPVRVSDGSVVIEINPDRSARAGVKLYKDSWTPEVATLRKLTKVIKTDQGYLLSCLSGTWLYLIEAAEPKNNKESSASTLGVFAGLSLEVIDIEAAVKIWEALDFVKGMGSAEQGWVTYKNANGMGVSFMKPGSCPHLFFNPSLTYFNSGENLKVIAKIREAGIPITEEVTAFNKEGIVDNVIIRDPGGYGFFVFND